MIDFNQKQIGAGTPTGIPPVFVCPAAGEPGGES